MIALSLSAGITGPARADSVIVASAAGGQLAGFVGPFAKGIYLLDGLPAVSLAQPRDLVVGPDGATVYVVTGAGLSVVDVATRTARPPIGLATGPESHIALTPDGRTALVTSRADDRITPVDTALGVPGAPITVDDPTDVAVSPDGGTAYAISADSSLTPVDLATGVPSAPIGLSHPAAAIAITPDGSLGVLAEADGLRDPSPGTTYAQVVDLASKTAEAPVALSGKGATALTLSADGGTAYVADAETRVIPFGVAARAPGEALQTQLPQTGLDQAATDVAATADGRHVLGTIPCGGAACGEVFSFNFDLPPNPPPGGNPAGATTKTGFGFAGGASAIALGPEPSASFSDAGAVAPLTHRLVSLSTNRGGAVAGFTWSFGDGSPAVSTAGPEVEHRFPAAGTYVVTLTTTNAGGCAAQFAFTGHAAACSGRPTASTTRTVTVAAPPLDGPPRQTAEPGAPAKLRVLRARVSRGRLDLRLQLTRRAAGTLELAYRSGGRVHRFTKRIPKAAGRRENAFSFTEALPRAQRSKTTGIVSLVYRGSSTVRRDTVRLRAASGKARLRRTASRIDAAGNLVVAGTISRRARGVVRVRLGYVDGGAVRFFTRNARIKAGTWRLKAKLPAAAATAGGHASIQFTGLERARIRGEQLSKQITR